jgi:hypothetical protein
MSGCHEDERSLLSGASIKEISFDMQDMQKSVHDRREEHCRDTEERDATIEGVERGKDLCII